MSKIAETLLEPLAANLTLNAGRCRMDRHVNFETQFRGETLTAQNAELLENLRGGGRVASSFGIFFVRPRIRLAACSSSATALVNQKMILECHLGFELGTANDAGKEVFSSFLVTAAVMMRISMLVKVKLLRECLVTNVAGELPR